MRRFTVVCALLFIAASAVRAADPYHLIKEIPIGGEGGWDYITVDPAAHRLYVSHATKIVVADIDSGKVVGEIPNTEGVHGFAVAADLGGAAPMAARSIPQPATRLRPTAATAPSPSRTSILRTNSQSSRRSRRRSQDAR